MSMQEDELFRLIAVIVSPDMFNEPNALLIKGKKIFLQMRGQIQQLLCSNRDEFSTAASILIGLSPLDGWPKEVIVPITALLAKRGLDSLCATI